MLYTNQCKGKTKITNEHVINKNVEPYLSSSKKPIDSSPLDPVGEIGAEKDTEDSQPTKVAEQWG